MDPSSVWAAQIELMNEQCSFMKDFEEKYHQKLLLFEFLRVGAFHNQSTISPGLSKDFGFVWNKRKN